MKYIKKFEKSITTITTTAAVTTITTTIDRGIYSNVCNHFDNELSNINDYKECLYSSDEPNMFYFQFYTIDNIKYIYDFLTKNKIKIIEDLHKSDVNEKSFEIEIYLTDEQMLEYNEIYINIKKYNL